MIVESPPEPPLPGTFTLAILLTTGPSKLKIPLTVPTTPDTDTTDALAVLYTFAKHRRDVAEFQLALSHVASPPVKEAVDVRSRNAKFSPLTVKLPPALRGKLGMALPDTTGASKEKSHPHF